MRRPSLVGQAKEYADMETHLGHLQVNVTPANLSFYKNLMTFLGWDTIVATDGDIGTLDDFGLTAPQVFSSTAII